MADSDRSRSPVPGRNRAEPRGPVQPVRQELPFFPRWCGPMQAAVWHSQQMSWPQFRPQFNMQQSGAYPSNQSMSQTSATLSGTWPNPRFPPAPPSSPPPSHQPLHIPFHLALPLHLAHLLCLVHQPRLLHPALHPFRHLSLVMRALHIWPHQEVAQQWKTTGLLASISILIGKRTKIITTIRRSTAWPSHEAFVNPPSHCTFKNIA